MPIRHLGRLGGRLDGSTRPKSAAAPQVSTSRRPRCPSSVNVRAAPAGLGRLVPKLSTTAAPVGQGREGPGNGPGRPARAAKPSGEGRRPGERREGAGSPARGRDGRLCRLARCAARHSRFSRPQAERIPRSSAPQVSKGGSHRQKRRCEIQRRRRPSSSELAMGPSVHRQRWRWSTVAWTWPASPEMTMLQLDVARDQVAGTPSSEAAMLEKKSRLDLGRLSRGRAAVIACNAPGRH